MNQKVLVISDFFGRSEFDVEELIEILNPTIFSNFPCPVEFTYVFNGKECKTIYGNKTGEEESKVRNFLLNELRKLKLEAL